MSKRLSSDQLAIIRGYLSITAGPVEMLRSKVISEQESNSIVQMIIDVHDMLLAQQGHIDYLQSLLDIIPEHRKINH